MIRKVFILPNNEFLELLQKELEREINFTKKNIWNYKNI